jgi:hypothetical protein
MNIKQKSAPSPQGQRQLEALRQAVAKTLEKKRRLGQYSVIWRDGKPIVMGEDAPENTANRSS